MEKRKEGGGKRGAEGAAMTEGKGGESGGRGAGVGIEVVWYNKHRRATEGVCSRA